MKYSRFFLIPLAFMVFQSADARTKAKPKLKHVVKKVTTKTKIVRDPAVVQPSAPKAKTETQIRDEFIAIATADVKEATDEKSIRSFNGKWGREKENLGAESFSYDVRRSDSIISPYTAVLKFRAACFSTDWFRTQSEANRAPLTEKPWARRHTLYYNWDPDKQKWVSEKHDKKFEFYF